MNTLIAVILLGVFCLLLEILDWRKAIIPVSILGLLATLAITVNDFESSASLYNGMIVHSKFSSVFSGLFIVLTIFLVGLSGDFYKNEKAKISDFVAIKLFLLSGAIAMVSFGNLAMFFLGIEVLSISLYILASSSRANLKSNEAGLKYFLMGSFASGIILFGICLIYGAMGSFDVDEISQLSQSAALPIWFPIGISLLVIGMLFKVAAVPFHFWAPDVYEGSPALTTALMSTLAKVVAVATLYKLVTILNANLNEGLTYIIMIVSMASMTLGNIMALQQNNVKRMLAFSGISHAGFMTMCLLNTSNASGALLYYTAAYAFAGIAIFTVIIFVANNKENETIAHFDGLGKSHPIFAAIVTASLLSMAGIPIFAGFFAKLFLFDAMLQAGYVVLVIVAILNSIVSIGYYFKLIVAMYTKQLTTELPKAPVSFYVVAIAAIVINILMGIFPSVVLSLL